MTEETGWRGQRMGLDERIGIRRGLAQLDPAATERSLEALGRQLPPLVEEAVEAQPRVARLRRFVKRAEGRGEVARAEQLRRALGRAREDVRETYALTELGTPLGERGAAPALAERQMAMTLGLEQAPVIRKLHVQTRKVTEDYTQRIGTWEQKRQMALAGGDVRTARTAQGQITRLRNRYTEELTGLAARQRLSREVWEAMPGDVQREVGRLTLLSDDVLRIEQQTGVPVSELSDLLLGYLHRALTPAGRRFAAVLDSLNIQTPFTRYGRQWSPVSGFTRRRNQRFEGMGVMQVNDWANRLAGELRVAMPKLAKQLDFGQRRFDEFFFEDPAEAVFRRMAVGGKAKASAEMLGGTVRAFHVPASAAQPGDMAVSEFLARTNLRRFEGERLGKTPAAVARQLRGTRYQNSFVPREFAEETLRVFKLVDTPEELKSLSRMFDQYNSMMRFFVTVPFPAYHIRNATSNVWLGWLAGMRDPRWYPRAMQVQRNAARALREGSKHPDLDLMRRMQDLHAVGGTITGEVEELGGLAAAATRGPAGGAVRGVVRPTQTGWGQWMLRKAQAIENNAKVALFMHAKHDGLSDIEAAELVKRYLFDYSALGPADKALRKWAFFYTFFRKNLPLEIQSLATDTRKMHFWGLVSGHVGESVQKELLPEYQQSRSPLMLGQGDDRVYRFLSLGLPFDDLFVFSGEGKPGVSGAMRIGQKVWGMGAPIVRALPELLTGRSLASGEETTIPRIAAGLTPASRVLSTGRLLEQVRTGQREKGELGRLVAFSRIAADPRRAERQKLLRRTRNALREMALRGRARAFTIYGAPAGDAAALQLQRLNRLRRNLEKSLSRRPARLTV
ncbi:MAG: hypothetical protein KAU28_02950 [Phycisphaerae bacterium]|nr:hypothetical protein [Phycisphaerae bacterium]